MISVDLVYHVMSYGCKRNNIHVNAICKIVYFKLNWVKILKISCERGNLEFVKFLFYKVGLLIDDFRIENNYALRWACRRGYLDIVRFLYKDIGLMYKDFGYHNNYACVTACKNGHLEIIKFMFYDVGLTRQDFRDQCGSVCVSACIHGYINIVKFLYEEVGLGVYDFRCGYNMARDHVSYVKSECKEVIKYLKDVVKIFD